MKRKTKKGGIKNIILTLVLIMFIVLIIISGINIFLWVKENLESKENLKEISNQISVEENIDERGKATKKYEINFDELKKSNSDTVAWLKVEETEIAYPVVKAENNEYYLTKSFDKTNNSAGWVFMDYRNKADGTDKNIVVYGHNRKDGSMFGTLKDIFNENWYTNEENKYITYIAENEYSMYEIFSAYRTESEGYYITTNFNSNTEFEEFIQKIKSRSFRNFGTEVDENDTILTLSTCSNSNFRVVLHAKKL